MRPGQDSLVLTELGQLSPEAVSVPGHLVRRQRQSVVSSTSLDTVPIKENRRHVMDSTSRWSARLFELSGQPLALLLYGDELAGLRGRRGRTRRREGTLHGWRQ